MIMDVLNYGVIEGVVLWGSSLIFFHHLPKRKQGSLVALVMLFLSVVLDEWLFHLPYSNLREVLVPTLGFFYSFLLGVLYTASRWSVLVYFSIWSVFVYTTTYELWQFLSYLGGVNGRVLSENFAEVTMIWAILVIALFLILGYTVHLWIPVYHSDHVGPRQGISSILLYIIFVALMTGFYEDGVFNPRGLNGIILIMAQVYCITVLYLQANLFRKSALRQELDTMKLLWNQQKVQYEKAKDSIAIINQKCHDLKHQLNSMRRMESSEEQQRYFDEIQESVDIYDSMVNSGNEPLNTVLTEKSLRCRAKGIQINCVADGARLNFMNPVDIYTVMGNALDNAIEAVERIQNPVCRVIDVLIYTRGNLLVITVTNPLEGELTFRNGIPQTTKGHTGYHGFGVPGMRSTVRKYGGELTASVDKGCFVLKMLLPLPLSNVGKEP